MTTVKSYKRKTKSGKVISVRSFERKGKSGKSKNSVERPLAHHDDGTLIVTKRKKPSKAKIKAAEEYMRKLKAKNLGNEGVR